MVRNNNNSTYHDTKLTYSSITRVKENFLRKKLQLVLKVIYLWYTSFFNKHHNLKLLAELIKKKTVFIRYRYSKNIFDKKQNVLA